MCIASGLELVKINAKYLPLTGDTLVLKNGVWKLFSSVYFAGSNYIAGKSFWQTKQNLPFGNHKYKPVGEPLLIEKHHLRRVGEKYGAGVFARVNSNGSTPKSIYLPLRPGCRFQSYER